MDRKRAQKVIGNVLMPFDIACLERWMEVYQGFLIDELYAMQQALLVLAWLKSNEDFSLAIDKETIGKAADTLVKMAHIRHNFNCGERGKRDYCALLEKTEKDFLGGLYLKSLVCILDTLAALTESDQDRQG